jgi:hypothetical protein
MRNEHLSTIHRISSALAAGAIALLAVFLSACGGGGSETPVPLAPAPVAQPPVDANQAALNRAIQLNEEAMSRRGRGGR